MIIGPPRTTETANGIRVDADVRIERPGVDAPESLWFLVPHAHHDHLAAGSDAFAVAMMLPAMLLGEDVTVEGRVSSRLAHGLREYRTAYSQWWPDKLHAVGVSYGQVAVEPASRVGGGTGCAFSGGVDSMYTVWRHMPGNESIPGFELTHAMLVNGMNFDVDPDGAGGFERLAGVYRPMLARNGIELVTIAHNAQAFLEAAARRTSRSPTLEGGVVSAALMLGGLFDRVYVSGSGTYRYEDNFPKGWHPSGLHLMSTNDTELMFDGGDLTRTGKTVTLSRWEDAADTLRVCWRPTVFAPDTGTIENCCRCPKCVRTMITLELAGRLDAFRTFPRPLTRSLIRGCEFVSRSDRKFYRSLFDLAVKADREDIARDLRFARIRSRVSAAVRHRILRRKPRRAPVYTPSRG